MKIQNLYKDWVVSSAKTDELMSAWENDLMNEAIEHEYDEAYKHEVECYDKLLKVVMKLTGVEAYTARAMVHNEAFSELMNMAVSR